MIIKIFTFLLFSLFSILQTKAQVFRSAYYTGILFWEYPMKPFRGETPITETEALKRIHLRFDYNKIIEVSVRIGNEYKELMAILKTERTQGWQRFPITMERIMNLLKAFLLVRMENQYQ